MRKAGGGAHSDCGQSLDCSIKLGTDGVLKEEVEQVLGHGVRVRVANDCSPSAQPRTGTCWKLGQTMSNTPI